MKKNSIIASVLALMLTFNLNTPVFATGAFTDDFTLEDNIAIFRAVFSVTDVPDSVLLPGNDAPETVALAKSIVGSETDQYKQLKLIHIWVTCNISYDMDVYTNRSVNGVTYQDALVTRRGVCRDIACAEVLLARAVGIRSLLVSGAINDASTGYKFSGHEWCASLIDGRWVVDEPTWDVQYFYYQSTGSKVATNIPLNSYFDASFEKLAVDHFGPSIGGISWDDATKTAHNPYAGMRAQEEMRAALPTTAMATPTSSTVYVDGKAVKFDAYNINGTNYFKLRDVAYALKDTEKAFDVVWRQDLGAIMIDPMSYTGYYHTDGSEMKPGDGQAKQATLTTAKVYCGTMRDADKFFTIYNIGGNNYFQLRQLGQACHFNVTWDGDRNAIIIDTNSEYIG